MYEFPTPEPITAAIRTRSGRVTVTAEECDTTTVDVTPYDGSEASREAAGHTRVEMHRGVLSVEAPESGGLFWRRGAVRVVVRVPLDSVLDLKTASADAEAAGRWREASVQSASGDVVLDEFTGDLNIGTASGDVRTGRVGGSLRTHTASGGVSIEAVGGDATVQTASGDIRIGTAAASVHARTASGDIDLGETRRGDVRVQTASGDVTIAVASGTRVYLDVSTISGSTSSDLEMGDAPSSGKGADLTVSARTVSGDVAVIRARETAGQT